MTFPILDAILFAILQGITELFPISSLGHGVLVPAWLHWAIDRQSPAFLPFMVVLHLGTAAALLLYFWRDWAALIGGFVKARGGFGNEDSRLMWRLVFGTIPAVVLAVLFEKKIKSLFVSPTVVLVFLAVNGLILLIGDRLKRRRAHRDLDDLSAPGAIAIGTAQALALIPGISRSGATLVAGLAQGLDYASAARFSFLLATPIIAAAGVWEMPKLLHLGPDVQWGLMASCGLIAGALAYASTWLLMRYFKRSEVESLRPFGWYCLAVGLGGLAVTFGMH
ncbi:MAG: undecaprenyl-diphosphate phosphatase [Burkholderiales bacterium]|nr:undecaprenyl-diphosphate phosphatase [Burkholderiales bacterium]